MAAWFKRDETIIGIQAHITTKPDGFKRIDDLFLFNLRQGNATTANQMLADLKTRFVGKFYTDWTSCRDYEI